MSLRISCTFIAFLTTLAGCATTATKNAVDATSASSPARSAPATQQASKQDAPEISRSRGQEAGVVILWPRVIDRSGSERNSGEIAAAIQQRLRDAAVRAFPGRPLDVRPEPERVCPQSGCLGIAIGALLLREENGCAVVALLSQPGESPETLVQWAGGLKLQQSTVPFREPPENSVRVTDFTPCSDLLPELDRNAQALEGAMQAMAR